MIDENLYFYRTKTPSTTEGVLALQRWKEDLFLDLPNQHIALKLQSMHNYIYDNFYNRKELRNSKRVINFIYDLFFELYSRNNYLNEIFLVKSFDRFISDHKHVLYSYDEEKILLYLNIFIETF
jgi:hypothetical protein